MDTRTSYLGLRLEHPFIAGASPLGYRIETIKRLEDEGWAAIVLHSLFEEQITAEYSGHVAHVDVDDHEFADILTQFPRDGEYPLGPDEYAEHVYRAKRAVHMPVIASMNGRTDESWLKFARVIQQAGADALELNMYSVATDPSVPGAAIEARLVDVVKELKRLLTIPIAVKLTPFFTSLANVARQLDAAGADAIVLFNRFYQPDIDIRTMGVSSQVELSTNAELLLRLRWIANLYGRVRPALAVSGGVSEPQDGVKAILAGADAVQMVSAVLRHGPAYVSAMRRGLEQWLEWRQMPTLDDARGAVSMTATGDAASFERAHYIRTLHTWTR